MTEENKNLLLLDLSSRLPFKPEGILLAGGETEHQIKGTLCGIDIKDINFPIVEVLIPGFKSPWKCTLDLFVPILWPFSIIYTEISGIIPWVEANRRENLEEIRRLGLEDESPIYTNVKFNGDKLVWEKKNWSSVSITYIDKKGREFGFSTTATFDKGVSYQIAYEMGIDISGLIEKGLAIERTEL